MSTLMQAGPKKAQTAATLRRSAFVSVVLPIYNEVDYVEGTLRSLLANEVPGGYEILVADGMSDDGTRQIVRDLAETNPEVVLVDNAARSMPHGANVAICRAKGDVIVVMGGHAEVASDFLVRCLEELDAHADCGCVGGPIEHVADKGPSEAIAMAMASPFGVGNAVFRTGQRDGYVDTVAFGAYRKEALLEVGLFDETLVRNQDDELNFRVRQAGYKIWLSRRINSRYFARSSFSKLFRQYFQYGYWKVFVNRKHGSVTTLRQVIPPSFVLGVAMALVMALAVPATAWLLLALVAAYFFGALVFAARKTRRPVQIVRVLLAFATLHFGYGLGYLEGILHFFVFRRKPTLRHSEISR